MMKWTELFILNLFIIHCYSAYKSTCPQHVSPNCSQANWCNQCLDPLCPYCQNTNILGSCGSDDCMTCIDGYTLNVIYKDGTGECVIDTTWNSTTNIPTNNPSTNPTTDIPSNNPSIHPTSNNPTNTPSVYPTTNIPSNTPVLSPPNTSNSTYNPSLSPTSIPTWNPTETPSFAPTKDNSQSVVDTTQNNTATTGYDRNATNESSDSMDWAVIIISLIIGCIVCMVGILMLIKRYKTITSKQAEINMVQNLKSVASVSSIEMTENQSSQQINSPTNDENTSGEELHVKMEVIAGDQDEEMYVNMNDNVTTNDRITMHGHVNDSMDDMYTITTNETTKRDETRCFEQDMENV